MSRYCSGFILRSIYDSRNMVVLVLQSRTETIGLTSYKVLLRDRTRKDIGNLHIIAKKTVLTDDECKKPVGKDILLCPGWGTPLPQTGPGTGPGVQPAPGQDLGEDWGYPPPPRKNLRPETGGNLKHITFPILRMWAVKMSGGSRTKGFRNGLLIATTT